jgi:peptidoglycan/LPS O-acetylase OafA/YrhL
VVAPFVCAGAGFLLAVLWFDLMFDVQVARSTSDERADEAVGSIATYYRRVTTEARPMNRLVAAAMLATLASIVVQIARADHPRWVGWVALVLTGLPVLLAGVHTVPSAVRLGSQTDPAPRQRELARSILRDHVFCASAVAAVIAIELSFAT